MRRNRMPEDQREVPENYDPDEDCSPSLLNEGGGIENFDEEDRHDDEGE
jgi:hypothetical protein